MNQKFAFLFISIASYLAMESLSAQVTNNEINYEIRIKEITQSYDNDGSSADDHFFKLTTEDPASSGFYPVPVNNGDAICGAGSTWFDYHWQEDAQSYRSPAYGAGSVAGYQRYVERTNQPNHNTVVFHIRSWEEDDSWTCNGAGNAGYWEGWNLYAFKDAEANTAGLKSSEWKDIGWIAGSWNVTLNDRYGDAQFRSTWRYANGDNCASALDFGSVGENATKSHINANRAAPTNAQAISGYSSQVGQSSPDVFYQFMVDCKREYTISTDHAETSYNSYLRLYSACGAEIETDDDDGSGSKAEIIRILDPGSYRIAVEGFSSNSGDFKLTVAGGMDVVTTAVAGPNQGSCQSSFTLAANAAGTNETGSWSWSGPGSASYLSGTDMNSYNAQVSFPASGVYTGTWTVSNNCGTDKTSNVMISVGAPDNIQLSINTATSTGTSNTCESNGWTYYEDNDDSGKYYFAIEWDPASTTSNAAAKSAASIEVGVNPSYFEATSATEGSWAMKRFWNVDLNGTSIDPANPVNVKFFYDPQEKTDIINEMNAFAAAPPEGFIWFKTETGAFDGSQITAPKIGNSIELIPSLESTENGVQFVQFDGLTSFSGGTGGSGAGAGGSPLPIELADFRGTALSESNKIFWNTYTEENTKYHVIERSVNHLEDFLEIGRVEAVGSSTEMVRYDLEDAAPLQKGYYRLRTIDFDGSEQLSHIISITRNKGTKSLSLYNISPNPAKDAVNLEFNASKETKVNVSLIDVIGKVVLQDAFSSTKGINSYRMDLSDLPVGIYILKLNDGNTELISKLIKK